MSEVKRLEKVELIDFKGIQLLKTQNDEVST